MSVVEITYFSDVLCIWAYVSQARVDAIKSKFGNDIHVEHRFCSVFGNTIHKISSSWKDKGGYEGFNAHLRQVAGEFPHVAVHPEDLVEDPPCNFGQPASVHESPAAGRQRIRGSTAGRSSINFFDQLMWGFRCAFFRDCRDISRWDVQCEIAAGLGADIGRIEERIHDGTAFAGLAADYQDADKMRIEGSPSLVLNDGRQKLYGNVGFRVIEANVQGLIHAPGPEDASWC